MECKSRFGYCYDESGYWVVGGVGKGGLLK